EKNNADKVALSTVDAHRPVVTVALADPGLDGNPDPGVWGRYIAGVPGTNTDILFTFTDADDAADTDKDGHTDRYNGSIGHPNGLSFFLNDQHNQSFPIDFSVLTPGNPNLFSVIVKDRYGLLSDEVVRAVQVVPLPAWLDNDDSSVTYDPVH